MKKLLALILAAAMLSAALASCAATPETAPGANIRVTSSDAADAAAWLAARLGERLTDKVVIGTDADGYGVDVSALEDDGFFIRSFGREDVLFAKTSEGLDRAVRKYAKMVESGEPICDETYHEGAFVGRLTVAGADISTFGVRVEEYAANKDDQPGGDWGEWIPLTKSAPEQSEDVTRLKERVEQTVVPALSPLFERLCGASLADEADAKHHIVFRPSGAKSFTEGDFRYFVEDGDLIFEYAELLGAKNGVFAFFEDQCGWQNVDDSLDHIAEADEIAIPEGLDVTVDPMLDGILLPMLQYNNSACLSSGAVSALCNVSYRIPHACNGWLNYKWGGYNVEYSQPCMSDPTVLGYVTDGILDYIEERLDGGATVGYDLTHIDVAHGDNGSFCHCRNCLRVYAEEGSVAGASVRFANAIWENLDGEGYGLLKVITYAYLVNHEPCRTRPLDNVWITFCADLHCTIHPLDGTKCFEDTHFDGFGSREYAEWIRGWAALTDNLYIWNYDLDYNIHPFIVVEQIWDDLHFLRDAGATRMYWQCRYHGLGIIELESQLMNWLNTHPKATKAEYYDEYHSLLELHYGSAWDKVAEAFALWEDAEMQSENCCSGWLFASVLDTDQMNYDYYAENCWEPILSLLSQAEADADCARQVSELQLVRACHLYHGCLANYYAAYETGDEAMLSLLEARYVEMLELLKANGKDVHDMTGAYFNYDLHESIHEMAWDGVQGWYQRSALFGEGYGDFRVKLLVQRGLYDDGAPLRDPPAEYLSLAG